MDTSISEKTAKWSKGGWLSAVRSSSVRPSVGVVRDFTARIRKRAFNFRLWVVRSFLPSFVRRRSFLRSFVRSFVRCRRCSLLFLHCSFVGHRFCGVLSSVLVELSARSRQARRLTGPYVCVARNRNDVIRARYVYCCICMATKRTGVWCDCPVC